MVLMRRHGATVAGRSLEEVVFRSIYIAANAALQIQAQTLGTVAPLNPEETQLSGDFNLEPGPLMRAWEYWSVRLDKADGVWRAPKRAATAKPKAKAATAKRRPIGAPKKGQRKR
jgi:hypothetical protein